MADFDFVVDTQEMASSIDGVSFQVGTVTSAVAVFQSAVIAAETAAANRICTHVDHGFFSLIRSQVTQKMAKLRSDVDSRFMELRHESQALAAIKTRMERDYHMVRTRYGRVFHSIDLSLRNRIFELDRKASDLVKRDIARIQTRMRSLQAQAPLHQSESVQVGQLIATSQTKANASRAITAFQNFLSGSGRQGRLLESMLFDGALTKSDFCYVPMLVMEGQSISIDGTQWDIRTPNGASKRVADAVNSGARSAAFAALPALKWSAPTPNWRARVSDEFRRLSQQPGLNDRVRSETVRLFEAAPYQVLAGGRS
jgi:hypothetical protein